MQDMLQATLTDIESEIYFQKNRVSSFFANTQDMPLATLTDIESEIYALLIKSNQQFMFIVSSVP